MQIDKIVSGGQTGADRAALDWAIAHDVAHEGWCPKGRKAEDGKIAKKYLLQETPEEEYEVRTEKNVQESDATVIMTIGAELKDGSLATRKFSQQHGKPCLHLSRDVSRAPGEELKAFVERHETKILNVAGPRLSGEPEIAAFVDEVLTEAFLIDEG
ncbi:MAG: putative molybdenum carrier protein [Verrucomicrobiota bacterium]